MSDDNDLFNDEVMNDMLLNPKAYGMSDGIEDEYENDEDIGDDFDE